MNNTGPVNPPHTIDDDDIVIVSEHIPNPPVFAADDEVLIVSHKKRRINRPTVQALSPIREAINNPATTKSITPPSPPPPPPLSRHVDCVCCNTTIPRCDSVILGPCTCAACRPCLRRQLAAATTVPVLCNGCKQPLDTWKAVAELAWQDADAAAVLERLAIVAMVGGNVKLCHACRAPFEYQGDGTKQSAMVTCPICHVKSCVLCDGPWHDGECPPKMHSTVKCPSCEEETSDCECGNEDPNADNETADTNNDTEGG